MKFLVIGQNKDAYYMLPPERRMEIMQGAVAYIEKYRKTGKCKEIYETADLKGSVSIWEVESSEESARLMLENPLLAFSDLDIQPLVEFDVAIKAMTAYLQKSAKKPAKK
jgi:muconolactone delta-isomerase